MDDSRAGAVGRGFIPGNKAAFRERGLNPYGIYSIKVLKKLDAGSSEGGRQRCAGISKCSSISIPP
jgi:hypothetical protein